MKSPASRCFGTGSAIAAAIARRPIIGDRRPPSPLDSIQPDHWLPEYTSDLLDLLHVLGRLIALEPRQADLLKPHLRGPAVEAPTNLREAGALAHMSKAKPASDERQEQKQGAEFGTRGATGKIRHAHSRGAARSRMIHADSKSESREPWPLPAKATCSATKRPTRLMSDFETPGYHADPDKVREELYTDSRPRCARRRRCRGTRRACALSHHLPADDQLPARGRRRAIALRLRGGIGAA